MKIKPHPKIEPLINDLKELNIDEYLTTNSFKKYCVKSGDDSNWREAFNQAESSRTYIAFGMNHERIDSVEALIILLNHHYENNFAYLFEFIEGILTNYCEHYKRYIKTANIIESLNLIKAPKKTILKIQSLDDSQKNIVPLIDLSEIWNHDKLEQYLNEMDVAIKEKKYNQVLTYSYTCLEGIYKTYIHKILPEKSNTDGIIKLSKTVKNSIKQKLDDENEKYPNNILDLISTITNAISEARNSFSSAHFDSNASEWLAVFSRDCVNSVGRLTLSFLEK